jgi:exoribonuclease R
MLIDYHFHVFGYKNDLLFFRLLTTFEQEVTPDAEIIDCKYSKSVIRSRASLTYDEAQARLDDP